jgi:hypothetical protein
VQRGHSFTDGCGEDESEVLGTATADADSVVGRLGVPPLGRLDRAAMAALTTCTSGGFIPQARHGGRGVRSFAVLGSKLDGTGLEKEQMGQIQVVFASLAGAGEDAAARPGVEYLLGGVEPSRPLEDG